MRTTEHDFFASANSGRGFINFFGEIFAGLEHLYIIKGGSGTGKSMLMKKAGELAQNKGMNVEYFHCSSDPESLDGIIIKESGIGIIDGTAPHTADPKYPGAYDEIVNVGDFWDRKMLQARREEIEKLVAEKSRLFAQTYRYLSAALTMRQIADSFTAMSVDTQKMYAACERLFKRTKRKPTTGKESVRMCEGITMDKKIRYEPYLKEAQTIYRLKDKYAIAPEYLNYIRELCASRGMERIVGYCPLDTKKINMIYLPETKTLFTVNGNFAENDIKVNMGRFIIPAQYRKHRNLIRYTENCKKELENGAYSLLGRIKELHFELERIYAGAMDFEAKERYQEKLLDEILG